MKTKKFAASQPSGNPSPPISGGSARRAVSLKKPWPTKLALRHAYIESVERGERSVGIDEIERLARALGIDEPADLLADD